MGTRKVILLKIHYFHVLTGPLTQKFHAYIKNSLKSSVGYHNGIKVFIEFSGKLIIQIFKIDVETPNFK